MSTMSCKIANSEYNIPCRIIVCKTRSLTKIINKKQINMNKFKLVIIGAIAFLIFITCIGGCNIRNAAVDKREAVDAKQKNYTTEYDNMWKKIATLAKVPDRFQDKSKEAFEDIYIKMTEARYKDSRQDAFMRWVQESNPTFDMKKVGELYEKVMNEVVASRDRLQDVSQELTAIVADYNAYIAKWPNSFFLTNSAFPRKEAKVITSTRTEEAMKTGKDDDIDIFNEEDKK